MEFKEEFIPEFLDNFEKNKTIIRNFEGCSHLELYCDEDNPSIYFTYSYWDSDDSLQAYRSSGTFRKIWSETKPGFRKKAEAWSLKKLCSLP